MTTDLIKVNEMLDTAFKLWGLEDHIHDRQIRNDINSALFEVFMLGVIHGANDEELVEDAYGSISTKSLCNDYKVPFSTDVICPTCNGNGCVSRQLEKPS